MLAVSSVDAAKAYYATFKELQAEVANKSASYKPLRVATIFSLRLMKNKVLSVTLLMKTLIPVQ